MVKASLSVAALTSNNDQQHSDAVIFPLDDFLSSYLRLILLSTCEAKPAQVEEFE
jgi:hypothetical protein